jgi:hypothetical protein
LRHHFDGNDREDDAGCGMKRATAEEAQLLAERL